LRKDTCKRGRGNDDGSSYWKYPWTCRLIHHHESANDGNEWGDDGGKSAEEEAEDIKHETQQGHNEDLSKN